MSGLHTLGWTGPKEPREGGGRDQDGSKEKAERVTGHMAWAWQGHGHGGSGLRATNKPGSPEWERGSRLWRRLRGGSSGDFHLTCKVMETGLQSTWASSPLLQVAGERVSLSWVAVAASQMAARCGVADSGQPRTAHRNVQMSNGNFRDCCGYDLVHTAFMGKKKGGGWLSNPNINSAQIHSKSYFIPNG